MKKLLILFAAVLTLSACDFTDLEDAIDNAKVIIGLEEIETSMSVAFVDAKTGELYDKSQLNISIVGSNAQYAIDMFSDPFVGARVKEGLVSFGIPNDVTPTEENPLVIEIEITGEHVISTTGSVRFTNRGANEGDITVVDRRNMPDNMVMSDTNIELDADGRTTEEVNISNAPANISTRLMSGDDDPCANLNQITSRFGITIPAGTVAPSTLSLFNRFGKVYTEDVTSGDLCGEVELLPSGATDSFEMLNTFTEDGLRTLASWFSASLTASSDIGEEAVLEWSHKETRFHSGPSGFYTDAVLRRLYRENKKPLVLFQPANSSDYIEINEIEFTREIISNMVQEDITYFISVNSQGLGTYYVIDPDVEVFNKNIWDGITLYDFGSISRYNATFEAGGMSADFLLPADETFNVKDLFPIDFIPEMTATLYIHGPTQSYPTTLAFNYDYSINEIFAPNIGTAKNVDITVVPVCPNPNQKLYVKGGIPTATLRYRPTEATNTRFRWRSAREMVFVDEDDALKEVRIKANDVLEDYNYDLILHFDGENYRVRDVDLSGADSRTEIEVGGGLCS